MIGEFIVVFVILNFQVKVKSDPSMADLNTFDSSLTNEEQLLSPVTVKHSSFDASRHDEPVPVEDILRLILSPHKDRVREGEKHAFEPIEKNLVEGMVIKLGRQVKTEDPPLSLQSQELNEALDRTNLLDSSANVDAATKPSSPGKTTVNFVEREWFKSKVVSRVHAELWFKDGLVCF